MKQKKIIGIEGAWFLFFVCSFLMVPILGVIHYITTAFILFITILYRGFLFKRSNLRTLVWILLFCTYTSVSKIWAKEITSSQMTIVITLIEIIIVFYCILSYVEDTKTLFSFMKIFINAIVVMVVAFYATSPIRTWGTEGMGSWLYIWRNAAGYYFGFAALMAIFLYYMGVNSKKSLGKAMFLVVAAIGTGSRKVFLLLIIAIVVFLFLQPGFQKKLKYVLATAVILGLFVVIGYNIPVIRDLYMGRLFAVLQGAQSSDSSTVVRTLLRQQALELFLTKPVFGNGLEGFTIWLATQGSFLTRWAMHATYSHCNYTELLANFGIVGFFLFYFYPVKRAIGALQYRQNKMVQFGIIVITDFILLDIGTVSYYFKFCMYILLIGILCIKIGRKMEKY